MNLIAKEYVLLRGPDRPGALVLSAGTGAAVELSDAIVVDERSSDSDVDALDAVLTMADPERRSRWECLSRMVAGRSTLTWIDECLQDLLSVETS